MEAFIGSITLVGFNFAMRNYVLCTGQIMDISENQALYSLMGTTYGGDGRTSFGIPDLKGRVPIGTGTPPGGYPSVIGGMYGQVFTQLTINHMPSHTHPATFTGSGGGASDPVKVAVDVNVGVTIPVSTQDGQSDTPTANCFLAKPIPGPAGADQPEKIYRSATDGIGGKPVSLGGVATTSTATATVTGGGGGITDGTVVNGATGGSQPIHLMQPSLGLNYEMCLQGVFPARN